MVAIAETAIGEIGRRERLEETLIATATANYLDRAAVRDALVVAWERAVEKALNDGVLTTSEETNLASFSASFSLDQAALDRSGALSRVVKAAVLRDILEGRLPQRVEITGGALPINLQKSERIVWVFQNTQYLEDRTRRTYVGGSHGASIRIAKGVYYRVGAFRGQPVDRTERVQVDTGVVVVTTRHIYFAGPRKAFRIKHEKIVSVTPFQDGVAIHRDAMTAKPQILVTGDGWFTYNLLVNIGNVSAL
jgi:hypothetical protein